jgi:hypothetical protein
MLGPLGRSAVDQHHVRVAAAHPVEGGPDGVDVQALDPAGPFKIPGATFGPAGSRAAASRRLRAARWSRLSIIAAVRVVRFTTEPWRGRQREPVIA